MSASAVPHDDLRERIVTSVREAKKPVTVKSIVTLSKAKKVDDASFRAALESATGAGQLFRWPDRGRSQYFWHVSPDQAAREAVLAAAATQALSKPDLSKLAKKLPGFTVKRMESVVSELIAEKQLQTVPACSGKSKLLLRTGHQNAYFSAVRAFVEKTIRAAGFDPAAFFSEDSAPQDKLTDTPVDAAALILEAVRSLEPVKGVPVSTLRLRNHLPHLSKPEFDAAALELRKKQEVFLSQHADPYNLSEEDKDLLIDGQDGTYYVAIAIR
jgi:hypothetical protein